MPRISCSGCTSVARVKQIEVQQSDDLRSIALRELGDASRWSELAVLNDLRMPFIVGSFKSADRLEHTLIWGDQILIPWQTNSAHVPSPASDFGTDIILQNGGLVENAGGDLSTITGVENLAQALSNRIKTLRSEMIYHPLYGSSVSLALGLQATPMINLMAASWTYEALLEEPRTMIVQAVNAQTDGDVVSIDARVTGVGDNTPVDLNLVLNP